MDDESIARDIIERYILLDEQLKLVGKCSNAIEATKILRKQAVDIIFLDIEMPHIDGLSFLKTIENPPHVIITTAFRDYALEGFDLQVVDYLLKPIPYERFAKAINKLIEIKTNNPAREEFNRDYIYLRADKKMIQVYMKDIIYIQGLSNYVRIYTTNNRPLITYQKLSHLENTLPSAKFSRIHRSYIVALNKISAYTATNIEVGDKTMPLGGSYKEALFSKLKDFEG